MSSNYKRGKQSKKPTNRKKRDLDELKKIHQLPSTPRYDYLDQQYGHNSYSGGSYGQADMSRRPEMKQREASRKGGPVQASTRPQQRKIAKKKKKRKTHFFIGRIFFFIIFIIGVIYLINIVIDTVQKPVISYQMVQRGMIDNSDVFSGLIVRNESVVENKAEGNMYLIAAEGEKVKKGGQVYQVLDTSETSVIEQDIQQVESNIEKVQSKRQDMSYYQNEIQAINNNINVHLEEYYMLSQQGSLNQTQELRKQVEYEISKRKNVHMKDSTVSLGALKDQKNDLASKLRANQRVYKAAESGWVSYYVDGFEEIFTPNGIDTITEKDIKEKYTNKSTTVNQIISEGDPAYKLIQDEKWYVVSFMPESWASRFEEGQTYEFMLTEDHNMAFSLRVEENIAQEKQHKVVFSSREQIENFSAKRIATFKSTQYIYEGLKIPKSAISERNLIKIPKSYILDQEDGKGVLKVTGNNGEYTFTGLNIQFEDDQEYLHVLQKFGEKGTLQLGDTIVNPAQSDDSYVISEVSTNQGVYVVNGRITKFKQLNVLASNEEYVIVKSTSTNGIKQFDQIVTNPKNIQEEQLLKDMDVKNTKN